ncbi:glycosyltransferase [Methylobacterium sp. A54F]
MFTAQVRQVAYFYPWHHAFDERFARLIAGERRVAYVYGEPDNSTFRYRVHNMIEALEARAPEVSASWFSLADAAEFPRIAAAADVIVICRVQYSLAVEGLVNQAKRLGRAVVFDTDDLVFDVESIPLVMQSLDEDMSPGGRWDYWFAYVGRIARTLQLCDRATATNASLAGQITRVSGRRVHVIPNFMNRDQLRIAERIVAAKRASGYARDAAMQIGYFSGSPSHNRDFAVVAPALARLLDDEPDVVVRLVGYLPMGRHLERHAARVETHPFQDYVNLQRLIGTTEINLAPLQDNAFTRCKSELKFFEAAVVGTVTIATPTPVFADAIRDGIDSALARADAWDARLRDLTARLREPGLAGYIGMAEEGRRAVLARYAPERQADAILSALFPDPV